MSHPLFRRTSGASQDENPTVFYGHDAKVLRREPLRLNEFRAVLNGWAKRDQDIEVIVYGGSHRFVRSSSGSFVEERE